MKKANHSEEAMLSNDVARVWFPKPGPGEMFVNSQCVNQVWFSEKAPLDEEETAARMLKYVYEPSTYKRREEKEYPLVLAIHGFTATARYFAENSS